MKGRNFGQCSTNPTIFVVYQVHCSSLLRKNSLLLGTFCVGNRNKQQICRFESGDRDFLLGNSAGDLFEMVQISDLLHGLLVSSNDLGSSQVANWITWWMFVPNRKGSSLPSLEKYPIEKNNRIIFPWEVLHIAWVVLGCNSVEHVGNSYVVAWWASRNSDKWQTGSDGWTTWFEKYRGQIESFSQVGMVKNPKNRWNYCWWKESCISWNV